jgi:hypothetical protein
MAKERIESRELFSNRTPSDGHEPTRTNMRSTDEHQEAGAPPNQDLARTPPNNF